MLLTDPESNKALALKSPNLTSTRGRILLLKAFAFNDLYFFLVNEGEK